MKPVYLLTGQPGAGKTSLIKQAIAGMKGEVGGFYTEEIRVRGVRQGFKLVTLSGQEIVMAHVDIRSPYRVSKYGVDIDSLERVGVSELERATQECDLVVIDEIGKMELYSPELRQTVRQIIDSGKRVLGTIMLNPNLWADEIKRHPNVKLVIVTRDNHSQVLEEIERWLGEAGTG